MYTRWIFSIMLTVAATLVYGQNSISPTYTITGTVWYNESYCLGTPPEEEPGSYAYPNQTFYVISTGSNKTVLLSFTSDSTGQFSFQLPPGEYLIQLEPNTYSDLYYQAMDIRDKNHWTQGPVYHLKVDKDIPLIPLIPLAFGFGEKCPDGPDRM